MFDLTGKRALVTGASGGIGAAIAGTLHARGAAVAISGTRAERLAELADGLGERAHVVVGDLADPAAPGAVVAEATKAMGGLDILINNAGVTRDNVAMRMRDEEFSAVLEVNLVAAVRVARAAMKGMMKQRWGRIVGITSVVAFTGNPGQANYAASKAGMLGMTKSLAVELAGRGVTVNCVAPGFITSAMTDKLTDSQKERILSMIPAGRMGEADEVAAAVVYLASNEAAYVTGHTVHINGGMAMP